VPAPRPTRSPRTSSRGCASADRAGLPVSIYGTSASPAEVILVEPVPQARFVDDVPARPIDDKACGGDPLDGRLREQGTETVAPHRRNRVRPKTQDGRPLRRYRRRWTVERLMAWLQSFRRILVPWESELDNYAAFVQLGCIRILPRQPALVG
jgi:transposase